MRELRYEQLPELLSLSRGELTLILQAANIEFVPESQVCETARKALACLDLLAQLGVLDTSGRIAASPHVFQLAKSHTYAVVRLADRKWLAVLQNPGFVNLETGVREGVPAQIAEKLQYDLHVIATRRGFL